MKYICLHVDISSQVTTTTVQASDSSEAADGSSKLLQSKKILFLSGTCAFSNWINIFRIAF